MKSPESGARFSPELEPVYQDELVPAALGVVEKMGRHLRAHDGFCETARDLILDGGTFDPWGRKGNRTVEFGEQGSEQVHFSFEYAQGPFCVGIGLCREDGRQEPGVQKERVHVRLRYDHLDSKGERLSISRRGPIGAEIRAVTLKDGRLQSEEDTKEAVGQAHDLLHKWFETPY